MTVDPFTAQWSLVGTLVGSELQVERRWQQKGCKMIVAEKSNGDFAAQS